MKWQLSKRSTITEKISRINLLLWYNYCICVLHIPSSSSSLSQSSPSPSLSLSCCSKLITFSQLSHVFPILSWSLSNCSVLWLLGQLSWGKYYSDKTCCAHMIALATLSRSTTPVLSVNKSPMALYSCLRKGQVTCPVTQTIYQHSLITLS